MVWHEAAAGGIAGKKPSTVKEDAGRWSGI